MTFARPPEDKADKPKRPTSPQTPEQVRERCYQILERQRLQDTAQDFFNCCRPCHKTEQWTAGYFEYFSRMLHSVNAWTRMSPNERGMLIAGAQDGVHWRGEPISQFIDITNEHAKTQEQGVQDYSKGIAAELARLKRRQRAET